MKKKKIIIGIVTAALAAMVVAIIYCYRHSATLIVEVTPVDATVEIGGKIYKNGMYRVAPQEQVQVAITREGFMEKDFTVDLKQGMVNKIIVYLVAEDGGWNYYIEKANQDSLALLLSMTGHENWTVEHTGEDYTLDQDDAVDEFMEVLSVRTVMPINAALCQGAATRSNCNAIAVNYDYYEACGEKLCLKIAGRSAELSKSVKDEISERMAEKGYELGNYEYFYELRDD